MDTTYNKDWRLRNSCELWRPNRTKQSIRNAKILAAETIRRRSEWDDECGPQAGTKPPPDISLASGLLMNDVTAFSQDAVASPIHSAVSHYTKSSARCSRTISASWDAGLSMDNASLCINIGVRTSTDFSQSNGAPHQEEFRQQFTAENLEQVSPRNVGTTGQAEIAIHLPCTVRDGAVFTAVEARKQPGLDETFFCQDNSGSRNTSPRKSKHVALQVEKQTMPGRSAGTSPVSRNDASHGTTLMMHSDIVDCDLVKTQDSAMTLTSTVEENGRRGKKVFVQPLNRFITGGPLHALASLTCLNISGVERPGTPAGNPPKAVDQILPLCKGLGGENVGQESLHHSSENQMQDGGASETGKLHISRSPDVSSRCSEEHRVFNMAYESMAIGQPAAPRKAVPPRKKLKMKPPCPKQTMKTTPTDNVPPVLLDIKSVAQLQVREQDMLQNATQGEWTAEHFMPQGLVLGSHPGRHKLAGSKDSDDKDKLSKDTEIQGTCVVTHSDHSIEVTELQDLPSRRRWPKMSPFDLMSYRKDAENSSIVIPSVPVRDELTPSREVHLSPATRPSGNEENDALQNEEITSASDSAKTLIARSSWKRAEVSSEEDSITQRPLDWMHEQHDSSSSDVSFRNDLRITIPCASVKEISYNSASTREQKSSDAQRPSHGGEKDLEELSNELQSYWEITSPMQENSWSCAVETPKLRENGTRDSPTSQVISSMQRNSWSCTTDPRLREDKTRASPTPVMSASYLPETSSTGPGNGTLGEPGQLSKMRNTLGNTQDEMSNESLACTTSTLMNSTYKPALGFGTTNVAEPSRTTPESMQFGKAVWPPIPVFEEMCTERTSLSSEKLCSILSYLGHVEESNLQENYTLLQKTKVTCYSPSGSRSPRTVLEHEDSVSLADSTFTTSLTTMSNRSAPECNANSCDGEVTCNRAASLFENVQKKIQHYKDKLAGLEFHNAELLREIEKLKLEKDEATTLEREKFGKELEIRAAEYKAAIQHHLALNEKMVKDKETLSKKCCNLAGILSTTESKFDEKVKFLQEQATQDLKKQKELWIAGEKPRREAWKEMKLKEIKEITIKGLEPHIEGIVEKHKQEIQKLETRYADETQKKLELQAIQQRQDTCELRDRLLKDRDDLLDKERMAALKRMNELAEKYEQQAMQLRMRISGDMTAELERAEECRRKDKQDAHELLVKFQKEATDREDNLRKSLERGMEEDASKREHEICLLRAQIVRDKNEWQRALDAKLHQEIQIKEKELQARCNQERDEQIEMIIEKMEVEKDEAIARNQQELLIKVERLMEEKLNVMKRMKDIESKCASLCQLSLEGKQKAEMELGSRGMQVESLERDLLRQADLNEQLKAQINQEKMNTRQREEHFEHKQKEEHDLLQSTLLDLERCNAEIEQMRIRKVEDLAEVEAHVRQAIENKDLVIAGLREKLLSAQEQIRHTELLLT